MAYLPELAKKGTAQLVTSTFLGLNKRALISDGEWAKELNLSTREYPALCPRVSRSELSGIISGYGGKPGGILAREKLCWVEGTNVYYNGTQVQGITVTEATRGNPKQIVGFGTYIVIFPDKVYFNANQRQEYGTLEREIKSNGVTVQYSMCRLDGTDYENVTRSKHEPSNPENGDYWIDTGEDPHQLKVYSEAQKSWQPILTVYTRIQWTGIGIHFKAGDVVELSGLQTNTTTGKTQEQILNLRGSQYIYAGDTDWICVLGLLDAACSQSDGIIATASRKVPDMEYVVEHENRLWGCHYGVGSDGRILNEIYASKLGDMKNWKVYQGTSQDSYTVSIGSPGPWTGAIVYNGYPHFFKEDCVHKIYGSMPSNFQVTTAPLAGVKKGGAGSLCQVGSNLMYMSYRGIEAYDGSQPMCVSQKLGTLLGSVSATGSDDRTATAGSDGVRYYLALEEPVSGIDDDLQSLYVYDAAMGIWHQESMIGRWIVGFAYYKGALLMQYEQNRSSLEDPEAQILVVNGDIYNANWEDVSWMAESGIIGWDMVDQKNLTRYNIRASMAEGSSLKISLQYDSEGPWETKLEIESAAEGTRTLLMPVSPRRCDHMRMRIEGTGDVKIYSIARILSGGGDGQHG